MRKKWGNPGSPGAARAEKAGEGLGRGRGGGGGDWEWPGSEGEGRPWVTGIPSGGIEERGREGAGGSPEKGGHPREQRCGSAVGALAGLRLVGPLETLNSLGRDGSALPPTAGLRWEILDWNWV